MKGWIYIVTNKALAGMSKLGRCDESPEFIVKKLDMAGAVPTPFQLLYRVFVSDSYMLLQHIRKVLWSQQKNLKDSWFSITDEEGISLIRTQIALYIVERIQLEIRNGHGHNDFETVMRIIDQVLFLHENIYQVRNTISEAREVAKVVADIMKHESWQHRDQLSPRSQNYL